MLVKYLDVARNMVDRKPEEESNISSAVPECREQPNCEEFPSGPRLEIDEFSRWVKWSMCIVAL